MFFWRTELIAIYNGSFQKSKSWQCIHEVLVKRPEGNKTDEIMMPWMMPSKDIHTFCIGPMRSDSPRWGSFKLILCRIGSAYSRGIRVGETLISSYHKIEFYRWFPFLILLSICKYPTNDMESSWCFLHHKILFNKTLCPNSHWFITERIGARWNGLSSVLAINLITNWLNFTIIAPFLRPARDKSWEKLG